MTESKQITTAEMQKTICINRTFSLPLNSVWKAWTEPESFKKWWGPKDYTCPHCSIDFRVGGKILSSMQGKDGIEIWSTGEYKEIIPHKKIVCTDSFSDSKGNIIPASEANLKMPGEWPLELLLTIEFEEVDGKTKLTIKHEGVPAESQEDCIEGWESSLDKLESNIK